MAKEYIQILTPVGRLVWGHPGIARDKKNEQSGEVTKEFTCGLAIPKAGEQHWNQTELGAKIWAAGANGYGAQAQSPTFSWKVIDGDSLIPNKSGNVPADQEGYKGHWIFAFSSRIAPRLVNANGSASIAAEAMKTGDWVQIYGSVADNRNSAGQPAQSPGVYLNLEIVALTRPGEEIQARAAADPRAVGFGAAPIPAAALATPAPAGGGLLPPAPAPAPVAVAPAVGFSSPGVPAAPPAAPVRQMLPAANGLTYEAYIASGWTDAQLIQNGLMAP